MYFKRLEMQGFKSFVEPTVLDLEAGITAVIGPNGCGKSNVVDSLRWVLGETSAKALRGVRMEDVIFNGTDQRKAVGMAEVTLTIDNQDHQLPTDRDEVTVTRRTYRSGETEYLLNKTVCRLRDIHDLFMDTGVGSNAYSVLEQGKIDLIVSSKPADRRFVFEEAAGISKYKNRKEESMRKLEAAEQNYLRVNDIAVEVRRQIGSLERQAHKARRYQELKQELTTLEVKQGRAELFERRRKLRKLEHDWEGKRGQIQELEQERSGAEADLEALRSRLLEIETSFSQTQGELHRLQEETIKAEEFIASSELRTQDLHREIERLRGESGELTAKEAEWSGLHSQTRLVFEERGKDYENRREELSAEEARLAELEKELKQRAEKIQDQQTQLLKLVDEMSSIRGALKNLESRRSEHEQQLVKLESRLGLLQEQKQESSQAKTQAEAAFDDLRASIQELRQKREEVSQEKSRLEAELAQLAGRSEQISQNLAQLTSRLAWIEELKTGLSGYEAGAKALLMAQAKNPAEWPGVLGPVANFLRTDPQLEFALEACLGHRLQAILVETRPQAQAALEFLKQGNLGRATLIPLDAYASQAPAPALAGTSEPWMAVPGVLGRAQDRIRVEERLRGLFGDLLASVILVENLESLRAARQAGAPGILVTLQGEVETPEGWISGGSPDLLERGLLGREREMEELQAEKRQLEESQSAVLAESQRAKKRFEDLQLLWESQGDEAHDMEIRAAHMEKSLEGLHAQLAETDRQYLILNGEREYAVGVLEQLQKQQADHALRMQALEDADRQTQEEIARHQGELENRRREYDFHLAKTSELRVSLTSLQQQRDSLRAEIDRMERELSDLAVRGSEKRENLERDLRRVEELAQQVEEKRSDALRWGGERQGIEQRLAEIRAERESLGGRQQEAESRLRGLQRTGEQLTQELHRLEMEKAQQEMNLKNLENYLQQEYQLNLTLAEEEPAPAAPEGAEGGPEAAADPQAEQQRIQELKQKLAAMGAVNLVAMEEYNELEQRNQFLTQQLNDLKDARENLQRLITKINHESRDRFSETFFQVREKFQEVFRRLFNGGDADLVLVDELNLLETGIEIIARPPGKRQQNISLLSGGEKALTAIALLFAIFLIKPSPFCIFDEMDAPLDDINTARFSRILREFAKRSQFIVITHNKITMEAADVLYGVTMQESGVSKLVSVKFKDEEKNRTVQRVGPATAEEVAMN